jgi:peptidoglycan/xylan/chitin deacetylase (PgdA/CDA1 family)
LSVGQAEVDGAAVLADNGGMKLCLFFALIVLSLTSAAKQTIEMAITVDDLPVHGQLPQGISRAAVAEKMVSVFKKYKIPEVYGFINAGKVEFDKENLKVLEIWRAADYPLANHSYSHMDLHASSVEDFQKDIMRNEKWLKDLNGSLDWRYFRYPYLREGDSLEKRNAVRQFLKKENYKTAQVTIDFEDWAWNNPYARCLNQNNKKELKDLKKYFLSETERVLERSVQITDGLFKRPVKHILLLHIGAFDAEVLDNLLRLYQEKGVKFISLSEALTDEIYQIDPQIAGRWGSELQYQILKSRKLKPEDVGVRSSSDEVSPEVKLEKVCAG